jgi:ribonuclease D
MAEAHWIEDQAEFRRVMAALETAPELALDTEFLRERTYFPRLCLLQLSAGDTTWLIDSIAVRDLSALAPILTRGDVRKIMHAGRQDLEVLRLATGAATMPVWDTQIASACLQARAQISYADLIDAMLGIKLDKGQTRTDWSRRPLTEAQRVYAVDDVRYLGALAAKLEQRLADQNRLDWAAPQRSRATRAAAARHRQVTGRMARTARHRIGSTARLGAVRCRAVCPGRAR